MSIQAVLVFASLFGLCVMVFASISVATEHDDNGTSLRLLALNVVAIVIAYGSDLNPLVMFVTFAAMSVLVTHLHLTAKSGVQSTSQGHTA
jgi:hypothetical protein